ncbi:MAG: ABC transporter permease [Armatimonadota bacterium]
MLFKQPIDISLPVFMKENRSRLRGVRGMLLLFASTILAIITAVLVVLPRWEQLAYNASSTHTVTGTHATGQQLLLALMLLEGLLCAFIVPALTAGAIVLERENRTFEFLLLTRLTSRNIVFGKVLSNLGFVALLLLCTLPVASIVFFLGGMSPGQVLWSLGLILAMAACLGAMGLYCSARFEKTSTAVAVAYALTFVWVFLMPLVTGLQAVWFEFTDFGPLITLIIAVVLSPALAFLATKIVSAPLAFALHREVSRGFGIVVFVAFTLFFILLNYLIVGFLGAPLAEIARTFPEYLLIGNPLAGIIHQMDAWEMIWPMWEYLPWTLLFYTPIAVVVQLLGAAVFLGLTIKRVERMRRVE